MYFGKMQIDRGFECGPNTASKAGDTSVRIAEAESSSNTGMPGTSQAAEFHTLHTPNAMPKRVRIAVSTKEAEKRKSIGEHVTPPKQLSVVG